MNHRLMQLLTHAGYMNEADAGEGGGSGGGTVDRGDDFAPTGPDAGEGEVATGEGEVKAAGEGEGEGNADPENKAASADAEDDTDRARDSKGKFIPKERFDEAVRKERAEKEEYQRRVKEFEEREQQRAVSADLVEAQKQVKALVKQHTDLLLDGEAEKAAALMEQILELKEAISDHKAEAKAVTAKEQAKEEMRYDALVAKLETDYPEINPEADEFDRASVKKVQAYMTGLMQTERMSPSQALRDAVETILGARKVEKQAASKEDLGMRRKEDAVRKALETKEKQPPSTKSVGKDHDKQGGPLDAAAVMKMNYDEFVKLPESKLAEMRGDFVS